jgi:general secretion pathway protein K
MFFRPRTAFSDRAATAKSCSGYALVTVIWSLGLISLLALATMVGARYRSRTTATLVSAEEAASAAESAINLGLVRAMASTDTAPVRPLRCKLPGGENVEVSIEAEAGKVDLNKATPDVLTRLFTVLAPDKRLVQSIVEQIVAYRDESRGGDTEPPDHKPAIDPGKRFVTILQLDQIKGIDPRLLRAVLPFVTVSSGRTEPDPGAATPALRELLQLQVSTSAPPVSGQPIGPRSMTIRADVQTKDGARFIRTALVTFGLDDGKPYRLREWRRGDLNSVARTEEAPKSCFQLERRAAARN